MKVLVCGNRDWDKYSSIYHALYGMPKDTIIINGDCKGADRLSTKAANDLGLEVRKYPANWDKYGKAAGPIRNQEMINKEHPDLVIAFHENIAESKGTKDMCKRAKENGIPVILITK